MSTIRTCLIGAALAVASLAGFPAEAHHSFAMFDRSKQTTLVGTVKAFEYTNPHSWIHMVVADSGSTEEWQIEGLSPNVLGRAGWKKNTLKPGDKISVVIYPLRDGGRGGNLITVTLPNGQTLGGGAS